MKKENNKINLQVKKLSADAIMPTQAYEEAACFDLYTIDKITIPALGKVTLRTGISVAIPSGYMGKIWTRSGMAANETGALTVRAGVIDADYRGELKVILANSSEFPYRIEKGDKIAQMAILPIPQVILEEVKELPETVRGEKGLGSSGK